MNKVVLDLPMDGRCQCGAVSYQIMEMPLTLYACHCTECQKQSSSGYGMSMPVPEKGFKVFGNPSIWQRKSASQRVVDCAFCETCGTRLYHMPQRNANIVNVKPGTLDYTQWIEPVGHLWTSSAQRGSLDFNDCLQYQHQPPSFDELFEKWKEKYEVKMYE